MSNVYTSNMIDLMNEYVMDLDDNTYLGSVVSVFGFKMVFRAYAVTQVEKDGVTDTHAVNPDYEDDVAAIQSFDPESIPNLVEFPQYPGRQYLVVFTPTGES